MKRYMSKEEQQRIVLLHSIIELGGVPSKQEVLEYIQRNNYWNKNDENDVSQGKRKEKKWRNEFAFVRQHLVDKAYIDNGTTDIWKITEIGREYFHTLHNKVQGMKSSDDMFFTGRFFLEMCYKEEDPEETEEHILLNSVNDIDINTINVDVELSDEPQPKNDAVRYSQHKAIYRRNPLVSARALKMAGNLCEIDSRHLSFVRKKEDCLYMEPHHLIPLSQTDCYDVNLDREQNIFSLCSNCHNQIHYGRAEDVRKLISILFEKRKEEICSILGRQIYIEELYKIYKVD